MCVKKPHICRTKSHSSYVFLMGSLQCIAGCVPIKSTWVLTTLTYASKDVTATVCEVGEWHWSYTRAYAQAPHEHFRCAAALRALPLARHDGCLKAIATTIIKNLNSVFNVKVFFLGLPFTWWENILPRQNHPSPCLFLFFVLRIHNFCCSWNKRNNFNSTV